MADDTRQESKVIKEDLSKEALTVNPDQKAFAGNQWRNADGSVLVPPKSANMLAGGTENTAGGKAPEVSIGNAVSMIKLEEFKEIHKKPCNRQSFMTGIGAGFGLGALKSFLGGSVWSSCSWSVGAFVVGSLAQHQYCMYRRTAERQGMLRAVEIMNKKDLERQAREKRKEQMLAERREAKDKEQDAQLAALKNKGRSWWKLW